MYLSAVLGCVVSQVRAPSLPWEALWMQPPSRSHMASEPHPHGGAQQIPTNSIQKQHTLPLTKSGQSILSPSA